MGTIIELPDNWDDYITNMSFRDRVGPASVDIEKLRAWILRLIRDYERRHGHSSTTHNFEFTTESSKHIFRKFLPVWSDLFLRKNADYGETGDLLGSRGQFADMWRKFGKLKRAMWDGEALTGEQPEEIIMDLIGHCFLSLYYIEVEKDAAIDREEPFRKLMDMRFQQRAAGADWEDMP